MYELRQVGSDSFYIECPARIGVVRVTDREVCLIDSGGDKDAGRRVRQVLDANGWTLGAIYLTHSHADHTGGSAYLQRQTGCRVLAPETEQDFVRHTILEPAVLYGGCPPKALRHKFLMAQPCDAEMLTEAALPAGFTLIPLPGHGLNMMGYRTPDDVVYLGDCLASRQTLDKYGVAFVYDVEAYLQTLEKVKTMTAKCFVPAHVEATEDIAPLAQYNIDKTLEVADTILALCREPSDMETILQGLFQAYGMEMNFQQYALTGSTMRGYLAWLLDAGRLEAVFSRERLLWVRTD